MKRNNLSNKDLSKKFWFDRIVKIWGYHYSWGSDIEWGYQDSWVILLIFSWKIIYWIFPTYNHLYKIPFDDKKWTISRNEFYNKSEENELFLQENSELSWEIEFREFYGDNDLLSYNKIGEKFNILEFKDYKNNQIFQPNWSDTWNKKIEVENRQIDLYVKNNNLNKKEFLTQIDKDLPKLENFTKYCREFYFS